MRTQSFGLETSITSIKRTVYLVALPLLGIAFAVLGYLAWRDGTLFSMSAWAFPGGLTLTSLAMVALAFRLVPLTVVEYGLFGVAVLGLATLLVTTGLGHGHTDQEATSILGWLGYWMPVLYGFVFMIFGVRMGAVVSIVMFLGVLGSGISHFAHPAGHTERQLLMLVQTYLSNSVIIVVLIGVASILRQRTHHGDRLEEEVHTDVLTGLPNRRLLSRRIAEEMARAERYHRPFAIALFDLDHFKLVNDVHGHSAGDEVLKRVGPMLARHVRDTDMLGRWGGEEFLVVLPEMDIVAASRMAERLRQVIEAGPFPEGIEMTASFGVARYWMGEPIAELLDRVDRALYSAKDSGRNRVMPPAA